MPRGSNNNSLGKIKVTCGFIHSSDSLSFAVNGVGECLSTLTHTNARHRCEW